MKLVVGASVGLLAFLSSAGAFKLVAGPVRRGGLVTPLRARGAGSALRLRASADVSIDPWGGRIGSLGTQGQDGYEVLKNVVGTLPAGYSSWKDVFSKIDGDRSGTLDASEMKRALTDMGGSISDAQIGMVMTTLDKDEDGEVSYAEFEKAMDKVEAMMELELHDNDVMSDDEY